MQGKHPSEAAFSFMSDQSLPMTWHFMKVNHTFSIRKAKTWRERAVLPRTDCRCASKLAAEPQFAIRWTHGHCQDLELDNLQHHKALPSSKTENISLRIGSISLAGMGWQIVSNLTQFAPGLESDQRLQTRILVVRLKQPWNSKLKGLGHRHPETGVQP